MSSSLAASWHCWASLWMLIQRIKFTSKLTRSQASPQWEWVTFHLLLPVCCIFCRCEGAFVKLHRRRNKDLPFIKITRLPVLWQSACSLVSLFMPNITYFSKKSHLSLVTFTSLCSFSFLHFWQPSVGLRAVWFRDNHRLSGAAGSLHKPLSCKCHSGSNYDLCQLNCSPRRRGHGPVVYRGFTHTNSRTGIFCLVVMLYCTQNTQSSIHSHTFQAPLCTQLYSRSPGVRARTFFLTYFNFTLAFRFKS